MAVSFTTAPLVAVGAPITSTQYANLAAAYNDRLRSGLGDPGWRIVFYFMGLFVAMRNGTEASDLNPLGSQPALSEFFEFYQNVLPQNAEWPATFPGLEEGANVSNPIMAFCFGSENFDIFSEDGRLGDVFVPNPSLTPEELWVYGKQQRGAYDPNTFGIGSPAFTASTIFYNIRYPTGYPYSRFGNSYGGYQPLPKINFDGSGLPVECADDSGYSFNYVFTALKEGLSDLTFNSCDYSVYYGGNYYFVIPKAGGDATLLFKKDYTEGPYTGSGYLTKASGDHINRLMINQFIKDFRGSIAQRLPDDYDLENAFDFQKFFTTQYFLSPNIGAEDESGSVIAAYPVATFSSSASAGALATFADASSSHSFANGFVMGSCLVYAEGLSAAATIEILNGSEVIKTVTATPREDGTFGKIIVFENAPAPALSVRLASALTLGSGGFLKVEATEQAAAKPEIYDAYLLLRLGGADGGLGSPEGSGTDETGAKEIGDSYFEKGLIAGAAAGVTGLYGDSQPAVNRNPLYDAARRFSQCVRIVPRGQLVGYAVEDGKSVLWFKRHALGSDNTNPVDSFNGIAPERLAIPSGSIKPEYLYYVKTGSISYGLAGAEETYETGDEFTGIDGVTEFTDLAGEDDPAAEVFEKEGIRSTAPIRDVTNEWLMGIQLKTYKDADGNIYKPSIYADYFALSNRCLWASNEIGGAANNNRTLDAQFNYGSKFSYAPEAPSGYNYADGVNFYSDPLSRTEVPAEFYKSCRLYEPDVEIESATVTTEGGADIVKLIFKTRFHHHENAPATIDRDTGTWNLSQLADEQDINEGGYRTMENGIRAYLVAQGGGDPCPPNVVGDGAAAGGADEQASFHTNGVCYPHFYFVKLIPTPYIDDNDTLDLTDTKITVDAFQQMETYLRAMCEGYVDAATTEEIGCQLPTGDITARVPGCIYDFTYSNLCLQAFGNRWVNMIPESVRADNLQGYGPIPNTLLYADLFNQLSGAVNLLTKVRLMLPSGGETRTQKYFDEYEETLTAIACGEGWHGTKTATTPDGENGDWLPGLGVQVISDLGITPDNKITASREVAEYRFQFATSGAIYAIPEHWRDMVEIFQGVGFFATFTVGRFATEFIFHSETPQEFCDDVPICGSAEDGYVNIDPAMIPDETTCGMFNNGTIDSGPCQSSWAWHHAPVGTDQNRCEQGSRVRKTLSPVECHSTFFQVPLS